MAGEEVFGGVAGFLLGQAGKFIGRQQDLTRKNQNAFFSNLQRQALVGNSAIFKGEAGVETSKNFKKMGGTDELFSILTKVAIAPTTQENREALLAEFDRREADSRFKETQAEAAKSAILGIQRRPGGFADLPAPLQEAVIPGTGAPGARVFEVKERERRSIREAGLAQQRIDTARGTLQETIAAGKSERLLKKDLRKVRDLEIKRSTSQLRGNIAIRSGDEFGLSAGQGETYARFIMKELKGSLPPAIAAKVGVNATAIAKSVQDSIKERDKGIIMLQKLSEADNPLAEAAQNEEGVPAFESKVREANSFIARHFLNMVQKRFLTPEEAQAQFDILAKFPDVDTGKGFFNVDRAGLLISIEEAKKQNISGALDLTIESFLTPLTGEERTPEEEAFLERQAPLRGAAAPELGPPGGF